jgi:uncharacterized protein YidB (DUF937 family)
MKAVKKDPLKKVTPTREPIYVGDKKNKRLKAYNDSLNTYELSGKLKKELVSKAGNAKTGKKFQEAVGKLYGKYSKAGLNRDLLRGTNKKLIDRGYGENVMDWIAKKPVQPVVFKEGADKNPFIKKTTATQKAEKANVSPKELSIPKSSIKVQKTVKLPSAIRDIKYDTQKGTVLVDLDGTNRAMPRKDFDKWVNIPENRKMFDDYRRVKAKK